MDLNLFIISLFAATIFWSLTIVIDRELVFERFDNPLLVFLCSFSFSSVLILPLIFFIFEIKIPGITSLKYILAIVFFYIFGYILYFRAISIVNASVISIFLKLSTIIVVLYGILIFKETYSNTSYIGIFLVLSSTFIISLSRSSAKRVKIVSGKGLLLMISSSICFSFMIILQKSILSKNLINFSNLYIWQYLITLFCIIFFILITSYKYKIYNVIKGKKTVSLPAVSQFFNECGEILWIMALSLGPVSLASVVSSSTTVFVLLLSLFIAYMYRDTSWENLNTVSIFIKAFSIIIMIIGFVLIFLIK